MTFKPAHKDTVNTPGQVVNEVTLGDYIARKQRNEAFNQVKKENKLTFKQWLKKSSYVEPDETTYCWLEDCWNAAQENK